MGDLNTPAEAVRCGAKDETEGCITGVKKSEGAIVPKKRVMPVEGRAPVTNKRKGETGWNPHSKGIIIIFCKRN